MYYRVGRVLSSVISFSLLGFSLAQGKELYQLEEIQVTAPLLGEPPERVGYEVKVVPKEELKSFGYSSFSGLDVRERGGFGVQEDLSLRGTTFEQNLVLLEGVRISDLQTGHHLTNLPFSSQHLKALEILPGGASPLYGAGGFGGALNFILEETKPGLDYKLGFGSYNFLESILSLGIPIKNEKTLRFNIESRKASAFVWNRDFDIRSFNLYSKEKDHFIFYGFVEKDFGARNFYTPRFDTEWEETRTHLFLGKKLFSFNKLIFEPALLYRKHYDYYLLDRYNPNFYRNTHENYLYRANLPFLLQLGRVYLFFGAEGSYEKLKSSRLDEYLRRSLSFYTGVKYSPLENLYVTFQGRYDYYVGEKDFLSWGIGLAYVMKKNLKLRAQTNYSFRLPSVTELRYYSLGIKGNPNLEAEKALNIEAGFDLYNNLLELSFTLFHRRGEDLIDWIALPNKPTVAENINVNTLGATLDLRKKISKHLIFLSYTYLNQKGEGIPYGRYYGNYLRHNLSTGAIINFSKSVSLKGMLSYHKRLNQDGAFLLDLELEKEVFKGIKFGVWGKNLLDEKYYEVRYRGTDKGVRYIPQWLGVRLEGRF
ncbi:MAG: TonB-dependent receptor plug domain-containing protein [Caldimicrobium sp.]